MTARASKVPELLDALKAKLDAKLAALAVSLPDPTLAGVVVSTGPLRIDEAFESIEFVGAETDSDWAAIGNRPREETGDLTDCLVWIVVPGAGEATIKAARDRAYLLLDVVAQVLRDDPSLSPVTPGLNSPVRVAALKNLRFSQGALQTGRVARILFNIGFEVRLPS